MLAISMIIQPPEGPILTSFLDNSSIPSVFRKGRGTRDQSANIHWIHIEKARELKKKKSTSISLTMLTTLVCGSQQTGKFLKRWEYQTTSLTSSEICMQVKKQQLEPDIEQRTGSKLGKEYARAVYCHPAYLTSLQSISCEMPG